MSSAALDLTPATVPARTARKRILHCAYSGLGGHAAVLFTLLDERAREEFDHFVLFFGVEGLRPEYARACEQIGVPFAFIGKRGRLALGSHLAVAKLIERVRPHVVMINGTPLVIPILAARALLRRRWAILVRETQANHLKSRAEWLGSYLAARYADAVVYLSDEYRAEVARRPLLHWRSGDAHVIPNGVDTEAFTGGQERHGEPLRLAMVSRLIPIKDHPTLIDAVALLVRERRCGAFVLRIAGDGPTRAALEARVRDAGLSDVVLFSGSLDSAQIAAVLAQTDIYVHCTFGETMSNSILQAMASSLPVIASDVRGVSNMIRSGEDGILVPVRDARALADAIEALVRSPERRGMLGANARRRVVADLSRHRMVERYRELFLALAGGTEGT